MLGAHASGTCPTAWRSTGWGPGQRLVRWLVQDSRRSLSHEQQVRCSQPLQRAGAEPCAIAGWGIDLALNRRTAESPR